MDIKMKKIFWALRRTHTACNVRFHPFRQQPNGGMRTFPASAAARRPPGSSYGSDAVLLVYWQLGDGGKDNLLGLPCPPSSSAVALRWQCLPYVSDGAGGFFKNSTSYCSSWCLHPVVGSPSRVGLLDVVV
jgi:hypothetical protein